MSNIVRIPFNGEAILAVDVGGKPHVVLRPAIERLGLDYSTQLQKLRNRSWATVGQSPTVAEDGKARDMVTVDVRTFLMLLATIDERRVREDVRPLLIAYQNEAADAIEAYWTQGGAINPRATEDQIAKLIHRAEGQARVLHALRGVVDNAWLDAKGRHIAARALGEEPEVDQARRPLTVGEYLSDKGVTGTALRSLSTKLGVRIKGLYVGRYGRAPLKVDRFVDGALRQVYGYTEAHRPLFDQAWAALADNGTARPRAA